MLPAFLKESGQINRLLEGTRRGFRVLKVNFIKSDKSYLHDFGDTPDLVVVSGVFRHLWSSGGIVVILSDQSSWRLSEVVQIHNRFMAVTKSISSQFPAKTGHLIAISRTETTLSLHRYRDLQNLLRASGKIREIFLWENKIPRFSGIFMKTHISSSEARAEILGFSITSRITESSNFVITSASSPAVLDT